MAESPYASINFLTAHDGFSLQDLVSYDKKTQRSQRRKTTRTARDNNDSWNCGAEGDTDDPGVNSLRERQKRNLIATLLFSQGVPMIYGGDEMSHSKKGQQQHVLPG